MSKVTRKQLDLYVDLLNGATGSPKTAYEKTEQGLKANPGHFYIEEAYGGYKLCRMCNEGGGCYEVSHRGTKAEIYNVVFSILNFVRE